MPDNASKMAKIQLVPELTSGEGEAHYGAFFGKAYRILTTEDDVKSDKIADRKTFLYDPLKPSSAILSDLKPGRWMVHFNLKTGMSVRTEFTLKPSQNIKVAVNPAAKQEDIAIQVLTANKSRKSKKTKKSPRKALSINDKTRRLNGLMSAMGTYDSNGKFVLEGRPMEQDLGLDYKYEKEVLSENFKHEARGIVAKLSTLQTAQLDSADFQWEFLALRKPGPIEWPIYFSNVGKIKTVQHDQDVKFVVLPDMNDDGRRYWMSVQINDHKRLVSIPPSWMAVKNHELVPYNIQLKLSAHSSPHARLYIRDPDISPLLRRMTPSGIAKADIFVTDATTWLFHKRENPIAAAGGGYVLLANKLHSSERERWFGWLDNLDQNDPWLPDAAILRGTLKLNGPKHYRDFDRAAECLSQAYDRGIPYYTLGCAWLQSGLDKLSNMFPELKPKATKVAQVAQRIDTSAVFTSLRL